MAVIHLRKSLEGVGPLNSLRDLRRCPSRREHIIGEGMNIDIVGVRKHSIESSVGAPPKPLINHVQVVDLVSESIQSIDARQCLRANCLRPIVYISSIQTLPVIDGTHECIPRVGDIGTHFQLDRVKHAVSSNFGPQGLCLNIQVFQSATWNTRTRKKSVRYKRAGAIALYRFMSLRLDGLYEESENSDSFRYCQGDISLIGDGSAFCN